MKAFQWANAATVDDAVKLLEPEIAGPINIENYPLPMGGGQDLLTTMKSYITRPQRVVNLKTINGSGKIEADASGLKIDALVTLTQIINHADVQKFFPGLVEAAHSIATPQIRNMGTIGGNLNQRPRCWYFRAENLQCLKKGGDTCYAIEGENKYHAIFRGGPCVMVHPSDLSPMLMALNATITIVGTKGKRQVPIDSFFVLPKNDVHRENVVAPGEIVTEIHLPTTAAKSTYLKFKERSSLDFAMASVAAAVEFNGDKTVKSAKVVLGGVAPIPWHVPAVDEYLAGKKLDDGTIAEAARIALNGADPLSQNSYKIPLTQTLVRRALAKVNA